MAENSYEVDGLAEITRLNRDVKIDIPLEEDVNTIAGFVTALFGRVPKKGEKTDFGNISFTILSSDAKKIDKLKMDITPEINTQEKPGE
ncbi:MAG TPA: transporter associated domain-containing protein [Candidatus Goldiibacteriota bacterium]|nr:transporter associated domain-containing protein [Candidatus Goldiibacteriota bacterium]